MKSTKELLAMLDKIDKNPESPETTYKGCPIFFPEEWKEISACIRSLIEELKKSKLS